MSIDIRKLTPELLEDYLNFFDTTPHDDNTDESKCYCVGWCSADHRIKTDFSSPEKRRAIAAKYVNEGVIKGYLAYHEGRVVGWCNANTRSDCLHCVGWQFLMKEFNTDETAPESKIKSIFCFVIAPEMQRKGIATLLMQRVCYDAVDEGFDYVEAYPKREFTSAARDFMGPVEMYIKHGFVLHEKLEKGEIEVVMRKKLHHI